MAAALGCALAHAPAIAQPAQTRPTVTFDIPAQPLGAALSQFGDRTGHEALYDASLTAGKRSHDLQGRLRPSEALEQLLTDTGLAARYISDSSFVLMPRSSTAAGQERDQRSAAHQRYYALLQHRLLGALCRSTDAKPGHYRLVMLLWLRNDGSVERFQRVGTIGSPVADRDSDATISAVQLDEPVPADFEQPVLIVIVPQAVGVTAGCSGVGASSDRRVP